MSKEIEACVVEREFISEGKSLEDIIIEILKKNMDGDIYANYISV